MAAEKSTTNGRKFGKSLWSDAWRKLRKDRIAVLSVGVLLVVGLGALFTPLLPLQPSDFDHTQLKYLPPTLQHHQADDLTLTLAQITEANQEAKSLRLEFLQANAQLPQPVTEEEGVEQQEKFDQQNNQVVDTYMRPYRDAGFPPDISPVSRLLIRARVQMFGSYSVPSICGRDKMGRDLFSRIFWGARVSLIVGIVATFVSLIIGVTYGAISGYAGGWVDNLMMRLVDVLYSVPFIFIVIFLLTILGQEEVKKQLAQYGINRITIFYVVVGMIYWLTMARVVRGQVLSLKNELYVESARAAGAGQARIVFRHLIPNVLSVVIVYLTLTIPRVMLFEAFLSFLGLGVQSPDVSWGLLAKDGIEVITPIRTYWWLVVFPSMAIGITLFALNFFGDSLRDALDPKMRDSGS